MSEEYKTYLNLRQTSKILGIKVRTIRGWISKGKIKAIKQNKSWMIPTEEIYCKEIQDYANKGREHSERIKRGKAMGMLHGAGQDTEESV